MHHIIPTAFYPRVFDGRGSWLGLTDSVGLLSEARGAPCGPWTSLFGRGFRGGGTRALREAPFHQSVDQHRRIRERAAEATRQIAHPDPLLLGDQKQRLELRRGHLQLQPGSNVPSYPVPDELVLQLQDVTYLFRAIHLLNVNGMLHVFSETQAQSVFWPSPVLSKRLEGCPSHRDEPGHGRVQSADL